MLVRSRTVAFKAVIFDLDGTLLDTIEDLRDSMNAALETMGFPGRSLDECKRMVGEGLETFVRRALPEEARDSPAQAARLKELMRAEYRVRRTIRTRPYDGIPETLDALDRLAIPVAVLSNKPHDATLAVMARYFSRWTFRAVFGARDGVPVKPDPAAALEILRIFGVEAEDVAYIGDTNTDMQTAVAAGMFAVGALWGFRTREELVDNGARLLLEKPQDALRLFE